MDGRERDVEVLRQLFLLKWKEGVERKISRFLQDIREEYAFEFQHFLKSIDHGLPHAANVYAKTLEILNHFSEEERSGINMERLEVMCVFHDAGRFLVPREFALNFAKRKRKGRILHEYAGVLLAEIFGYNHRIIREGILRHDYFNSEFDPGKKPPISLEAQIFRAADKTSVAPADEIERYDQYRRKFNFPLFKRDTPIEFRLRWNFSQKEDPRTDQLCYFFAVLALRPEDFIHPVLQEYYRDWAKSKKAAVEKIIRIVKNEEEGKMQRIGDSDLVECALKIYLKAHDINI